MAFDQTPTLGIRLGGVSRRSLLTSATLAGFSQPARGAADVLRLPRKVRLALIGLEGHLSAVLPQLDAAPDVELVAVCDPEASNIQAASRDAHVARSRQYSDYRRLLDSEKLDVVAVYLSNSERPDALVDAAGRGLHVIAEKPLAIEREQLEKVKSAILKNGVRMTMLLAMRSMGPYIEVKRVIDSGAIGEVVQISAQKSHKLGQRPGWMRKRSSFGGSIPYIGVHLVDFMRWASGREFVEAASYQSRIGYPEYGDMENNTATIFRMDNGGTAVMRMDYLRPETAPSAGDDRVRFAGTRGVVEYLDAAGTLTIVSAGQAQRTVNQFSDGRPIFIDFLDSVYNTKPHMVSLADIYRASEIVLGARESAELHRFSRL
jgi:predicted dehydrogenase